MKVSIISTSDDSGGASKPAINLLHGLVKYGFDSKMLVQKKFSDNPNILGPETKIEKLKSFIISPGLEDLARTILFKKETVFHSPAISSSLDWKKLRKFNPDIVHLHWICRGFLKPKDLLKIKKPIVLTMHDMWPFCGGEHYAINDFYKKGYSGFNINNWIWKRKRNVYKKLKNLTLVAPSNWLAGCAKESILFKNYNIKVIPYGLDLDIYKPIDKVCSRNIFNIPLNKKIIIFGANNGLQNPRKGFKYLQQALNQISREDLELVVFGSSKPAELLNLKIPIKFLGKISDQSSLTTIYSLADVTVVPSVQDNLPNIVMESLACGTPVVGFKIGGIPDMIEHQKNGYLSEPLDSDDLAQGIEWVLSDEAQYRNLSRRAREKCKQEYTIDIQAKKYIDLYNNLTQKSSP